MNVSNIINQHVADQSERTAIIFEERRISYRELDRLIYRIAGGLINLDLKDGDVFMVKKYFRQKSRT